MKQKIKSNGRIIIDPKIMVGKPVIKGTRIPIYVVLNLLGNGHTYEEVIKNYPDLTKQDIIAAIKFASKFTNFEEVSA